MTDSIYDTRLLRQQNLSRVLKAIRSSKGISRAELSRHLGLSRSSVSSLTDQLFELGVIQETHLAASSGGRPPRLLQLNPDCCMVIGVDLGSSHIAVFSMNLGGEIQLVSELELDCCNEPALALDKVVKMVHKHRTEERPLLGVGVAVPSPVVDGCLSEQILPAWKGIHVQSTLEEMLNVSVFVGNDANLGALAEHWWGACQAVDEFVFVKMATGVGAGLIQNGTIMLGDIGYAGELGHVPISKEGLCRCGMRGCLEAHIGLPYLNEQKPESVQQTLVEWLKTEDQQAQDMLNHTAQYLSVALSILVNLLNPRKIVLWGPIPQNVPRFLEVLRSSMESKNLWTPLSLQSITLSALGNQGIAHGAATLVLDTAFTNPLLFQRISTN